MCKTQAVVLCQNIENVLSETGVNRSAGVNTRYLNMSFDLQLKVSAFLVQGCERCQISKVQQLKILQFNVTPVQEVASQFQTCVLLFVRTSILAR